ncbi:unnamed protein product [Cyprideis torosa]|uniref:Uncharacterized protein n=1 Tax=Cyprideis torosa TaxID=163714 RepID=A0A7R8ZVX1_9CRUS|nr:unnamed protein product [Cyprideis torosa]CAG0904272.1 unnamed protein product [Cyprideis torosa]
MCWRRSCSPQLAVVVHLDEQLLLQHLRGQESSDNDGEQSFNTPGGGREAQDLFDGRAERESAASPLHLPPCEGDAPTFISVGSPRFFPFFNYYARTTYLSSRAFIHPSPQHTSSDAQSLYLRGVTREASDTYCCEVRVGGPRYLTRNACAELVVAVRGRLSIDGVYSGQEVRGEKEVHANCTYAGSNPYANLQWYMDGLKVPDLNGSRCYPQGSVIQYPPESQNGLEVAFLGLMVHFCPQRGLSFAHPVSLHLECRAEVANVYYDNQTVNITIWDPAQPVTKFEPRYPAFGNSYTSSAAPCCSPLLLSVSMFVVLLDLVSQISLSRSCEASET